MLEKNKLIDKMNNQEINQEQLTNILSTLPTPCTLTITTNGEVKMNKTNNPFYVKEGRSFVPIHDVTKEVEATYNFGWNYEQKVNESLSQNPENNNQEFKSKSLPWGEWFLQDKIIKHKDKYYLRVFSDKNSKTKVNYFVDKKPANPEEILLINNFKIISGGSAKQKTAGIEEENLIIPNNICFDNISEIIINNISYKISQK